MTVFKCRIVMNLNIYKMVIFSFGEVGLLWRLDKAYFPAVG
jgi:hypothetical protein